MANTGSKSEKGTFKDTTMNSGSFEGSVNENTPNVTQASETTSTGKGWSRSDEDADAPSSGGGYGSGQPSSTYGQTTKESGAINLSSIPGGRAKSAINEGLSQVQHTASDLYEKAQDVAGDVASKAKDFALNAGDKTSSTIRQYPTQSLLVGFGLGCLIGFLIPRR